MVFPAAGWKPEGWKPVVSKTATKPAGSVDFKQRNAKNLSILSCCNLCFWGRCRFNEYRADETLAHGSYGSSRNFERSGKCSGNNGNGNFFALFNGLGRIMWGMISDKIGRKSSIGIMMATQGAFVILFQWMAGMQVTLYIFAVLIGFNYGGLFSLFPTITADIFGNKNFGQNYGWVFLAYAIGGIIFPILGGKVGRFGKFPTGIYHLRNFVLCGSFTFYLVKPMFKMNLV
jgi:MFS transporter, OFA family, oxalate/formate antiporter